MKLYCIYSIFIIVSLQDLGYAHNGPPFRVLTNQRVGPCILNVWTHANIGTSPIWIVVSPVPGETIPDDLEIEADVTSVDDRNHAKHYIFHHERQGAGEEYTSDVTLDYKGMWQIHFFLRSTRANGEYTVAVQATPHGFGRWDLLLYALPFIAIGSLWIIAFVQHNRRKKSLSGLVHNVPS